MKIGIIGAQSNHSMHFSQMLNAEKRFPGYSVTHIYGADAPALCAELCRDFGLINCTSELELIDNCDAVVITYRKGYMHYTPAMETLKKSKPLFNDKPFAVTVAQAEEITGYAREHSLLLCGGSNLKGIPGLAAVRPLVVAGSTLVISFAADFDSEYDGYWFYGMHSAELCLELCGAGYSSVVARRNGDTMITTVLYPDRQCIILNSPAAQALLLAVYHDNEATLEGIPLECQSVGPTEFIAMLQTKTLPREYGFYTQAVRLVDAIIRSARQV